MTERPITAGGETCPCRKAMFNRVARRDDSTDGLVLHYDICPACGFEAYAHNSMKFKREMWEEKMLEDVEASPHLFTVFAKQLAMFRSDEIRTFVIDCFEQLCPEYFWYIPASVRGHHPPICRTQGGLVHHIKLAFDFADSLLDMESAATELYDQVLAGVLLHDMMKRGPCEDELRTWATHKDANTNHGRYCAAQIRKAVPTTVEEQKLFGPIIRAVELHMGRWTYDINDMEVAYLATCDVTRLVHMADYCASRALHQFLAARSMDESMGYL